MKNFPTTKRVMQTISLLYTATMAVILLITPQSALGDVRWAGGLLLAAAIFQGILWITEDK